ncbi:MAG TPA: hypothetical protein VF338_05095, partial [Leptolinea sp.]
MNGKRTKVLQMVTRAAYVLGVLFLVSGLSLSLVTKNVAASFNGAPGGNENSNQGGGPQNQGNTNHSENGNQNPGGGNENQGGGPQNQGNTNH